MKKILLTLVLLVGIVFGLFAQKLTYQAVIRDNNQQLVTNTAVTATVTIDFAGDQTDYNTTITGVSTNIHGLLSFEFGGAELSDRDWTNATIAVKVVNAATPSIVYVNDDARPVSAVPYALSVNGQSIQNYLNEHHYVDLDKLNDTLNAYSTTAAMDARHYLTSDSAVIGNMRGDITTNANSIADLTLHTAKAAIRDSVAGQIHDSIVNIAANAHTHGNKDLLDTYNQTNTDLTDAVAKKHEHANAEILNNTTATYTNADSTKLDGIEAGAEVNVQADWNQTTTTADDYIKNKPGISDTVNTILTTEGYVTATALDARHYLTSDSAVIGNMRGDITTNANSIADLTLHTAKAAIRDSVAGQIHDSIAANAHTHGNKDLLDTYNQTNTDLTDAVAKKHEHANAEILNNTTATYTNDDSTKLDGIEAGAEVNVQSDWKQADGTADDYIKNKPSIKDTVNTILTTEGYVTATALDARHYLTSDSAVIGNMRGDITANASDIANLTLHTAKSALRDSVAGQIHDSISNIPSFVEQQVLSISNDTIYLTGGSYVKLPAGFSGNYNDLSNKPTIPTTVAQLTDAANYLTTGAIDSLQNVQADWSQTTETADDYIKNKPVIPTIPTNVSAFTNDAGYLTKDSAVITTMQHDITANENNIANLTLHTAKSAIRDSVAGQIHDSIAAIGASSTTQQHSHSNMDVLSATTAPYTDADSTKLDGIETGAQKNVQADWSQTTETADDYIKNKPSLAAVATSGDYNDLTNKPSIRDTVNGILDTKGYLTSTSDVITTLQSDLSAAIGKEKTDSTTLAERIDALESASMNCNDVKDCIKDTLSKYTPTNDLCNVLSNCQFSGQSLADLLQGLSSQISSLQNQVDAQNRKIDSLSNLPHGGTGAFTCGSTVTDHQGNVYNTLQIGNQCWTKENMRCTTSPITGASILVNLADATSFGKKAFCYDNVPANADNGYGLLYNWYAAVDTFYTGEIAEIELSGHHRGICPKGWHVPSDGEWTDLTSFVKSQPNYRCGENEWDIAKALASKIGWKQDDVSINNCSVGRNSEGNNATGFSALPAGYYHQSNGFVGRGDSTLFWSSTSYNNYYTHDLQLSYVDGGVMENQYSSVNHGLSVRCVWDGGAGGGDNPGTPSDDNTCCSELGARLDSLENVVDSLANLINNGGGDTPTAFTCGTDKVKDVDNNEYNTVAIGNQCWMKENLRTKTLQYGQVWTKTDVDSAIYGRYYDWQAAMQIEQGNSTSYTAGDKHRGICPAGWHVPSDAEWTALTDYVKSKSEYQCGGNAANIAKALSQPTGWSNTDTGCNAGNTGDKANATGFSAVPAGLCFYGSFDDFGDGACFWSATQDDDFDAWCRGLYSNASYVVSSSATGEYGFSVRCLRDAGVGGGDTPDTPGSGETAIVDTVFCYPNLGANTPDTNTVTRGENFNLSLVTFTHPVETNNWEIASWNTKADGTGTSYATNATFTTTGNLTLYAQWRTFCTGTPSSANEVGSGRIDSLKDSEGNKYAVVQIGNQCWMKENLRTNVGNGVYPKYPNGHTRAGQMVDDTLLYGRLYTWSAVTKGASTTYPKNGTDTLVHGICPTGWHVPSDAEWDTLTKYVFSIEDYKCGDECDTWQAQSDVSCIAKALSSTTGWSSNTGSGCNAGNKGDKANATGFSAVPAGGCYGGNSGDFGDFGDEAYFWSATLFDDAFAWCRDLHGDYSRVYGYGGYKDYGFSVRCLRDAGIGGGDTPDTPDTPTTIEDTVFCYPNLGANTPDTNKVVRGESFSLSTVMFSHPVETNWEIASWNTKADGTGTRYERDATISNIESNITLYAQWRTFCTVASVNNNSEIGTTNRIDTLKDGDNNKYSVVQIGNQCWMKENLRTNVGNGVYPKYPNGHTRAGQMVDDTLLYGRLYTWSAVTKGASTTYPKNAEDTLVHGICPTGWHVPSDAEWDTLTTYVKSVSEYVCDGCSGTDDEWYTNCIAKALSQPTGWSNTGTGCNAGNTGDKANLTGFSAVLAGFCFTGSFYGFGNYAYFWSATQIDDLSAWSWSLRSNGSFVLRSSDLKDHGFSVRCVRDN